MRPPAHFEPCGAKDLMVPEFVKGSPVMSSPQSEYDQSDRPAHPWAVAEPGSWSELAESTAFVFRAGGLALHPVSLAVCACVALAGSWALPINLEALLPWMGEQGWGETLWAWFRLVWLVTIASLCGVVLARLVAARPSRAEVWRVLPSMLGSGGLCASTYLATLAGAMLATWLVVVIGSWIGNPFGASLAAAFALLGLLVAVVATVLLLLAIPAVSANDADAPDAAQRAAAHVIARPGLSLALVLLVGSATYGAAWLIGWSFDLAYGTVAEAWLLGGAEDAEPTEDTEPRIVPQLVWLPMTLAFFAVLAFGWAGLTQVLLTLREVVDREDRASCWDPVKQAAAIQAAVEARAQIARGLTGDRDQAGGSGQDESVAPAERA